MKEDHCWPKSDLNQTNIFIEIRPKSDLNVTKIDRNQTMAWYGLKTRFETKLCPSWWSQIICVHSSQDKFWRWYVHRFTNYTQLYHGLEAILHYGQVDVDSSLQNRTFERKIGPFSDQFAPKSPIADQSPRKSDLVGTLHIPADKLLISMLLISNFSRFLAPNVQGCPDKSPAFEQPSIVQLYTGEKN